MKSPLSCIPALRLLLLLTLTLSGLRADQILVPTGSVWRYRDDGSDQGTAWRAPAFDDTAWAWGPAQLGYGDGDEVTTVAFGPNSSAKFITTYFRTSFNVADPAAFTGLNLRVLRDDGVVVYLNGVEVFRDNLPAGSITYTTPAPTAISGSEESTTFLVSAVSPAALVTGTTSWPWRSISRAGRAATSASISSSRASFPVSRRSPAAPTCRRRPRGA